VSGNTDVCHEAQDLERIEGLLAQYASYAPCERPGDVLCELRRRPPELSAGFGGGEKDCRIASCLVHDPCFHAEIEAGTGGPEELVRCRIGKRSHRCHADATIPAEVGIRVPLGEREGRDKREFWDSEHEADEAV
jgi:hypothetical protein